MPPSERDVRLDDGRVLRVLEAGDPHGHPVFFLHGTPGSRLLESNQVEDAHRQGLHLIGHDRPGYGGSTPRPGRRIVDEAEDVSAIADAYGWDRFAVYGHSGGGAPALACAAQLSKRLVAASSMAALAPYAAEGLDWYAGMGDFNVADFKLMVSDRAAWERKAAEDAKILMESTPEQMTEQLSSLLSEVDRTALTGERATFFLRQGQEALRPGIAGARDDGYAQAAPWGFDLSRIQVPLQYWHGKHDKFVPFAHGEWLAARLPRAEIHLEPEEGHVSIFANRVPAVHAWLASHF